ncbi:MAG: GNAT family N-acetyltransferase [Verrucomicrobiales bacterium]
MIEVVAYEPDLAGRWNQFVETAKNGHFMFDRRYMDYHQDRFPDRSLMFMKKDQVVAVLPAHEQVGEDCDPPAIISHGGLSFGGFISGRTMSSRLMFEIVDSLLVYMKESGFSHLRYAAIPHIYHAYPAEEDLLALMTRGAFRIETKVSSALRVGSPPGYGKSRRHLINSAKKQAGTLEIGEFHDVAAFHSLVTRFLERRHGAKPVHSREELELLIQRFPDSMKIFAAHRGGELLAVEMVFISPTCYRLQYKASTEEGGAIHANDLIEDYLIQEYAKPGQWLDFGTSMIPGSQRLDKTLMQYKESFGARAVLQSVYQLDTEQVIE